MCVKSSTANDPTAANDFKLLGTHRISDQVTDQGQRLGHHSAMVSGTDGSFSHHEIAASTGTFAFVESVLQAYG